MIVIPAIDIYENKIVRLTKGSFDNITYYKNSPIQQAKLYESLGFKFIHIVDLLGSKTGKFTALESVRKIKEETNLLIEFGGGIRDIKTVSELFNSGVDFAIIGSLAVKNKQEFEKILSENPPDKIIAAVDVKDEMVYVSGWTEETSVSLNEHIKYCSLHGIDKFLCTDISKDGMLSGPNKEMYKKIINEFPRIKLYASGGVKDMDDIYSLNKIDPYAVVVGKSIYEDKVDLEELSKFAL